MSTTPPIPAHFNSALDPDTGQMTRLVFDQTTGKISSLAAYQGSQQVFGLNPVSGPLFTISFSQYEMVNSPAGFPGKVQVVYKQPDTAPVVEIPNANELVFRYDAVSPASQVGIEGFGAIQVKIIFRKAIDNRDMVNTAAGWIDLDLEFTYPEAIKTAETTEQAWMVTLNYPDLRFNVADIYSANNEYLLLDPFGGLQSFRDAARSASLSDPFRPTMPVPFAAIYQLSSANQINSAKGVALAAVDNYANHKELFHGVASGATTEPVAFGFRLITPMYLNAAGQYVRPATYRLSNESDQLFSGAGMRYRIRCFNIQGRLAGVPVDWYDVAEFYRKWVKRTSVGRQFQKLVPHRQSPVVANMNPHTIAINYSIDGQIDPNQTATNNPNIKSWLEVHPVASDADMPNNPNETIPSLLTRVQNQLNHWTSWQDLGGELNSAPSASFRLPDNLDVLALGKSNQLTYTSWDGFTWSAWKDLSRDVVFQGQPTSVSWGPDRIDAFVRGTDNYVYHFHMKNKSWKKMVKLSYLALALAAASSAPSMLDLFLIDASSPQALHVSYDGKVWSGLTALGNPANVTLQSLAACFRQPNQLYVFGRDGNGALWYRTRTAGSWDAGWTALGGIVTQATPTVVSWASNRLDVFVRGAGGNLRHAYFNGTAWSIWETLVDSTGSPSALSPSVLSPSRNRLELFSRTGPATATTGRLLHKAYDTRLEAQLWGFEIGGFYRYLAGLPPATNIIKGDLSRFKNALLALENQGVLPSATTDPLTPNFNRRRFRGHLLKTIVEEKEVWVDAIADPFPASIEAYFNPPPPGPEAPQPPLRGTTTEGSNNRVLLFNPEHPDYKSFDLSKAGRLNTDRNPSTLGPPALDYFYGGDLTYQLCPLAELETDYLNLWLKNGLLDQNFRLIEFMKHHFGADYCYDNRHAHVVPITAGGANYTNAIGHGSWHLQRMISLLNQLQQRGAMNDGGRDSVFSLTCEFTPLESLVPYVDEFYDHASSTVRMFVYTPLKKGAAVPFDMVADSSSLSLRDSSSRGAERRVPIFHFIYSERISQKMNLIDMDNLIHPGYKEKYTGQEAENPMLYAVRDDDKREKTFAEWRDLCASYCVNFEIETPGIAPVEYQRLDATKYTYNRAMAATFNLRSWIFRYGAAAVMGERIILTSAWFELPDDYYREAIQMGALAAFMQMRFKEFFSNGYMLGQTQIEKGNKRLWAWRVRRRNFSDIQVLVDKLKQGVTPIDDAPYSIGDAISRDTDVPLITPVDSDKYVDPGDGRYTKDALYNAFRITTDKIQHMVWARDLPRGKRELLYVFANVGNRDNTGTTGNDPKVQFLYSRGLETGKGWKRVIYTFDSSSYGRHDPPKEIKHGDKEAMNMSGRSLKVVRIFQ